MRIAKTYRPVALFCLLIGNIFGNPAVMAAGDPMTVTISGSTTVCTGGNISLTATVSNGSGTLTYQWYKNGSPITGISGPPAWVLVTYSVATGDQFSCTVTSSVDGTVNSDTLTATVVSPQTLTIGIDPNNITFCQGDTVNFTATSGYPLSLYQWSVDGAQVSGATSSTFSTIATTVAHLNSVSLTATSYASCLVNDTASYNLSSLPFTIYPVVTPSVAITTDSTGSVCSGANMAFSASPAYGGSGPSYQWMINGSPVSGAYSSTFSTTSLTNGQSVTVQMTSDTYCASLRTVTSDPIVVSILPPVGVPSAISGPTTIPQLGATQYSTSSLNATSYNWSISPSQAGTIDNTGKVSWSDVSYSGATTISVTANGCDGPSAAATLIVTPQVPLAGGTILSGNVTLAAGKSPGPIVANAAYGGAPGSSYSYQWQQSSSAGGPFADIGGATGLNYSPAPLSSTTYFQRKVYSGTDSAYTQVVAMTVGVVDSLNQNFVRIRAISRPGITDTATAAGLTDPSDVQQTTQYFDGLGNPIETVAQLATPLLHDLVTVQVYDPFGRESVRPMPYAARSGDGNFKLNALNDQVNFNTSQFPGEQFYYGQTDIERSDLNRTLATYSPGLNWVGSARNISDQYQYNTVADSVQIWNISLAAGSIPTDSGAYAAGQLYKNITIDEQGHHVVEFKDLLGHIVLKKAQIAATAGSGHVGWLCTYYVYDVLNNLRFVIQPNAVQAIDGSWTISQGVANELCFRYEYDQRRRMIIKKVPGAGEEWMIYDVRDRPVMTQDSNLRAANQWLVSQYDSLNRPVETGLITYSSTQANIQQLVTDQTGGVSPMPSIPADTTLTAANETGDVQATQAIEMDSGFSTLDNGSFIGQIVNGTWGSGGSTTNSNSIALSPIPAGVTLQPLTITYYDDYSWVGGTNSALTPTFASGVAGSGSYFITSYNTSPTYALPVTPYSSAKGLVTGSQSLILGTNGQYLYGVNFYDDHSRLIQAQSMNYTGGLDTLTTQYDFSGKPLRTLLGQAKLSNTAQYHEVLTKTNYDVGFRITSIWKNIDGATADQLIDSMQYDELGQLRTKYLGKDPATGAPLDSVIYDYNIRGWVTGINKNYVAGTANHYFGMELGYDNPTSVAGTTYANPAYNGNIAGTVWRSAGDGVDRKYDFTYDNVNRLTGAAYLDNHSGSGWDHSAMDYSVSGLTYDANGNILTMMQKGFKIGNPDAIIDSLHYRYEFDNISNKLTQVTDGANDTASLLGDFHFKGSKQDSDYRYDGNGSLTLDNNKGIDTIVYNYLNLPSEVHMKGEGNIFYTYDATGSKLQKQTIDSSGGVATTTLYLDGFQYQRRTPIATLSLGVDTLQFMGHEEGRARWAFHKYLNGDSAYAWEYDFMERDHLGNTRVLLTQEKDTAQYMATMEAAFRTTEDALFYNIDSTSYARASVPGYPVDVSVTNPNDSVARVNGNGPKVGPAIILKVMAGDKVDIGVQYYYNSMSNSNGPSLSPQNLLNSLASGLATLSAPAHGSFTALSDPNSSPLLAGLTSSIDSQNGVGTSKPQAYLNWVLLDNQFNYVGNNNQSGALQVGPAGVQSNGQLQPQLAYSGLPISKSGYLYIYVSNSTPGWDVFFDNLSVKHFSGPLTEENHYYPGGLTMAGISDRALKSNYAENKYRYNAGSELQNKEFSDLSGLELYTTNYRLYDPQLMIFRQIDPLADINESLSTYSYGQDDPVLYNDPFGLLSDSSKPQVLQTATVTGHKNQSSTSSLPPLLPYGRPRMITDNVGVGIPRPQINTTARFISAEVANKGLPEPAYAKGTTVTQYRTTMKQKFVRVFNPKNGSKAQGKWMMKESEIQGLTPEQIQEKFAIPGQNAPSEIVEVEVPAGTLMQVGYAGTNAFGTGGGVQYEAMEAISGSSFGTPTALPIPSIPTEMPTIPEFPTEPVIPEGEFIPGELIP